MKIIIVYPPLKTDRGCPTLGQNRQFQYFKEPTYIYPVVPATAATLLRQAGHEALWFDCLAEDISNERFKEIVKTEKPDLVVFETKTPVVKQHWKIIDELKELATDDWQLKTVLFGDHVTALPEESFKYSRVDFVLTGGDYDFLLLNLCNALQAPDNRPQADKLESGIWYRENGQINPSTKLRIDGEQSRTIKNTGTFKLNHDLNTLPFIDRKLTKWQLYAYKNGNYKRTPGTYIMSSRDCWWGRCTFCSWPTIYPQYRSRKPGNVLEEIGELIDKYRVQEIMDDSGTLAVGDWLRELCSGMVKNGYHKKIYLDCNMRFGALGLEDYKLMKEAGFRLLLFGLESANQKTLDRINKNVTAEQIVESCKLARAAGLFPHITIMFGYPWETYEDAIKTFELGCWLLKKGYAYTMQATIVIPYPGTPLFEECKKDGLLNSMDWSRYDMKEPIMKIPFPQAELMKLVQRIYSVAFQPEFLWRKLATLRDKDDFNYYLRAAKKVFGHIFDFKRKDQTCAGVKK